jgi:hypothetical protein
MATLNANERRWFARSINSRLKVRSFGIAGHIRFDFPSSETFSAILPCEFMHFLMSVERYTPGGVSSKYSLSGLSSLRSQSDVLLLLLLDLLDTHQHPNHKTASDKASLVFTMVAAVMSTTLPRNKHGRFASSLLIVTCIAFLLLPTAVDSFAASSKKKTSTVKKGTGFGAPKTPWKVYTPDETVATVSLTDFLLKNKASISNTEIGFDPISGKQGLYATKNFKEGQVICQVPSDCALALSDPAAAGKDAPTVAHNGLQFLQRYWKNTVERTTTWAPYLDTLPEAVPAADATPNLFPVDELELLEFPRLVQRAKERQTEMNTVCESQDAAVENKVSLEELQFATWIVTTRSFPIQMQVAAPVEEGSTSADKVDDRGQVISMAQRHWIRVMVPFIDIANHNSDANAQMTLIDPEKDDAWFALKATRSIPQGREINMRYGSGLDSSVELLLNYGIVPAEENKIDALMLRKGGDDCIANLEGWSTTLAEDEAMLEMTAADDTSADNLRKILAFRIKMKKAYTEK